MMDSFFKDFSQCFRCKGSGMVRTDSQPQKCPWCKGTGRVGFVSARMTNGEILTRENMWWIVPPGSV